MSKYFFVSLIFYFHLAGSLTAWGQSSDSLASRNKATPVVNPTILDSVKSNPNGNWMEKVKFLMNDNRNKEALSVLRSQGEALVNQNTKQVDSLKSALSNKQPSTPTQTQPQPAVQSIDSNEEENTIEETETEKSVPQQSDGGGLIWVIILGCLAFVSVGWMSFLLKRISGVKSQSTEADRHVALLNEKIGQQSLLEKKANDLVSDIDQVLPLTSSETPFLALVVNDKNHPFIKPAKEIISGTQILKRMVTDLPKPTVVGVMRKTNVNRLIEEVSVQAYYSMRDHYPDFSCEMRRDLEKILPDTELNAEDIRFVLFNILENAFESVWNKKSSSGKGYIPSVTITSRKLPRYIQVRVKDNGTGVPDHVRKQIFQPFFTDREGKRHTGLGLHESYDLIVNKYKGDLILENDFQSSTDFIIRLPLKS
ncbi:MAG: sensor histidine kinase [Bacteroidota bacterium]|jgi:hypothetical protein